MAADWGFTDLSKKAESYEICFVPDNDYRGFLKRRVDGLEETVQGGSFVDQTGKVIGTHEGYPFYTIGQRKGLGTAFGKPMFVTEIRPDTNTVVLGELDALIRNSIHVGGINLMKYDNLFTPREVVTQIRYNDPGALSEVTQKSEDQVEVSFHANVRGVAPGQSAVFYEDEDVVGGGIIYGSKRRDDHV
jgi:tRNA-specific 2-thiouridylase